MGKKRRDGKKVEEKMKETKTKFRKKKEKRENGFKN